MYLASLHVQNYRCFIDETITFGPGVNVLIGENNAGKSTVISALGLLLDQRSRRRPGFFDFHHPSSELGIPPAIRITATFRSSPADTIEDKALVAAWLTKLTPPWEAQITYVFQLEPDDEARCASQLAGVSTGLYGEFRSIVESYLDKYVTRRYGGNPQNQLPAERESLEKIDWQFLGALRDAERELFAGSNPLLKRLLRQVRDYGKTDAQKATLTEEFRQLASNIGQHMRARIGLDPLLATVKDTGAYEGGVPILQDEIAEDDILAALRLYVETNGMNLPAELNGLGYNNLIYISLILASLDYQTDPKNRGPNATVFPILCIEEPEAHLHPALQYKLLKHVEKRVRETKRNRQVFVTTHSTHITSACDLDHLICLTIPEVPTSPRATYPGKCFADTAEGKESKAYVERYLDATKSNLLFSKGVLLVEGIAELLLVPALAEYIGCSLEEHHVAIVAVGGLTFRHFLPLFGAGCPAAASRLSDRWGSCKETYI
jgi:putative ATP-dependent endonuclease of OLD family